MTYKFARLFLIFWLFLSTTYFAEAQFLVGPVVSAQVNWVTLDDGDLYKNYSIKPQIGFQIGGGIAFRVQKRFFLNASLLYSFKRKEVNGIRDPLLINNVTYSSIDMPIIYTAEFSGKVGRSKTFKWFIGIGPTISYWLGGSGTIQSTDAIDSGVARDGAPLDYDIVFGPVDLSQGTLGNINKMYIENANRVQLGLNFVTGVVLEPHGFNKIMLTARFEVGHSFFSDNSSGKFPAIADYADNLRSRNMAVIFSAGYFIDLKTSQRKKGKSTSKKK
jgi:Outer membrane protein beta-barrel domain